ncbi:MAG TPA: aldehyde dehydrogenase family protein [Kofleriaceae bacterium]|nr:aldehyde dehydrogenase family protein [Kofleriaceae bacterium]
MSAAEFPAYLAGRFVTTSQRKILHAPFDGAPFASVSLCGPAELDEALAASAGAEGAAAALPAHARSAICRAVADGLRARASEIADGMVTESGKPIGDAEAEVERAIHCFELASAEAERIYGEVIPLDLRPASTGRWGLTRRFPLGLVAGIAPFNFPLNLAVHKIAPAMAAGCPIVLKPATQTPTSCLRLAEIIDGTAWPKGALSIVPSSREAADVLTTDERPRLLSFTGSPQVGWAMKARAGKKKVVLELGGNAAVIIDESADLDAALPKLVYGAFSYAGQKCISVQRIYVHARRWDEFRTRFVDAAKAVGIGDPRERQNLVGPMIDEANARRIEGWIAEAGAAGATVLCGGPRRGTVVPPTVLTGVPATAKLACEEAFGPTVNLEPVASFDAGLERVNDSAFGLQCGVFTSDLGNTMRAFERLVVGAVIVNDAPSYRIDHMPYGGVKDSGFGREGIRHALRDMTEKRLLVLVPPTAGPPVAPQRGTG